MVIVDFGLDVAHLRGQELLLDTSAHQQHCTVSIITLTVTPFPKSSRLRCLRVIDYLYSTPTTLHLQRIQWLNHPFRIRINPDEPLVLVMVAGVLMVEEAGVALSLHQFLHIRFHVALRRQILSHPLQARKMNKMTQLYKLKRILNKTIARNRICVGSAQNLSNIMQSRSATIGRAMSVRYACVRCTKSWTAHSARCASHLPYTAIRSN